MYISNNVVEYCLARSFESNINLNGRASSQTNNNQRNIVIDKIRSLRKHMSLILLMGVNGAGKGKKGLMLQYLTAGLGVYRIVMSELIERHELNKTPLGLQFAAQKARKDAGRLLSHAPVFEAIEQEILAIYADHESSGSTEECVIILDGFPRIMEDDDTEQLKHFMSYRIPFTAFNFKIDEATCLHRVNYRAETEGKRGDEASAPDRFVKLGHGNNKMLRVMKAANPHSVVLIDGTLPVRDQIMRILKKCFSPSNVMKMAKCLDNPKHAARDLMDKIEGKKPHLGGATAHSIPRGLTEHPPSSGGDARELLVT